MGRIIEFPITAEIQQRRQEIDHNDLDKLRQLGIVQTFVIQAEDDEGCEVQWMDVLLGDEGEDSTLYVSEPGEDKVAKNEGLPDHQPR